MSLIAAAGIAAARAAKLLAVVCFSDIDGSNCRSINSSRSTGSNNNSVNEAATDRVLATIGHSIKCSIR